MQRCRIGNNIIKITEISVLQMFVNGYSINIYNSTSVIINCVSFFCLYFVSHNKGGVVLAISSTNKGSQRIRNRRPG